MLNMGGPATVPEVNPFLNRLFADGEIIQLGPLQNILGPFIVWRRAPRIEKQYEEIGGSPILKWTNIQGNALVKGLTQKLGNGAPDIKHYVGFRYAHPLIEDTLQEMKKDGIKRVIAFSQYPHYSCTTSGSSFNHIWRSLRKQGMEDDFEWSLIDRWPLHQGYIKAVANDLRKGLEQFDESIRDRVVIVFSSHSLPLKIVRRGDQYPQEMAASVQAVMQEISFSNPYIHAWQSKVGPLPWIEPKTDHVLEGLAKQGHKHVLVIPLGFTSDHVETLFELDIEYREVAEKAGIEKYVRAPALNDNPVFLEALTDIVHDHILSGRVSSTQYRINCAHCVNETCRTVLNPIAPYQNFRSMNA